MTIKNELKNIPLGLICHTENVLSLENQLLSGLSRQLATSLSEVHYIASLKTSIQGLVSSEI